MSDTNQAAERLRQRDRRKPMSIKEARLLKIDDRVVIRSASHTDKVGVISKIDWPTFTIALLDSKNRRYHRTRKCKSLYYVTKADRVPAEFLKPNELPGWLSMPVNEDYEIAADFCAELGMEEAAIVLRDARCNSNRIAYIDSIVMNRDTPHLEQLNRAVTILADFTQAQDKLNAYAMRLTELQRIGQAVAAQLSRALDMEFLTQ